MQLNYYQKIHYQWMMSKTTLKIKWISNLYSITFDDGLKITKHCRPNSLNTKLSLQYTLRQICRKQLNVLD